MKIRLTLEVDLGNNFINENDKEELDWLLNKILTKENLFLHDKEVGDKIGEIIKITDVKTIT